MLQTNESCLKVGDEAANTSTFGPARTVSKVASVSVIKPL